MLFCRALCTVRCAGHVTHGCALILLHYQAFPAYVLLYSSKGGYVLHHMRTLRLMLPHADVLILHIVEFATCADFAGGCL